MKLVVARISLVIWGIVFLYNAGVILLYNTGIEVFQYDCNELGVVVSVERINDSRSRIIYEYKYQGDSYSGERSFNDLIIDNGGLIAGKNLEVCLNQVFPSISYLKGYNVPILSNLFLTVLGFVFLSISIISIRKYKVKTPPSPKN